MLGRHGHAGTAIEIGALRIHTGETVDLLGRETFGGGHCERGGEENVNKDSVRCKMPKGYLQERWGRVFVSLKSSTMVRDLGQGESQVDIDGALSKYTNLDLSRDVVIQEWNRKRPDGGEMWINRWARLEL